MKKVMVNVSFKDRYTGKVYKAGKTYDMTAERVSEIKETDKNLIEVVGTTEDKTVSKEVITEDEEVIIDDDIVIDDEIIEDAAEDVAKTTKSKKK